MQKEELKHYMLVFYTLKYLSQKEKVKVLRELKGYKETKQGKLYEHSGLLQEINGEKLGSNVIIIPIHNFTQIRDFFGNNNVKIDVKEVWLK